MHEISKDKLKLEWEALAPEWIEQTRNKRDAHRSGLLDGYMLAACGVVNGLRILDSGCGEGRFCRLLAERGAAEVLGIDLCQPLIDAAKALPMTNLSYRVGDAEDLSEIQSESLDLVVSYLNQCDLPQFERNNEAAHRILKKNGRFIVANLHPMRSAVGGWKKDAEGRKEHAIVDRYFEEGQRKWKMLNVDFTNFHRTLATYMNAFLRTGFMLEKLVEPRPTAEQMKQYPEIEDEDRVPNFIIYILRKGSG